MAVKRPRGTNDFLPEDTAKWQYVEQVLRDLCKDYGYEEIRTPQVVDFSLWEKSGHAANYADGMFTTHSENRNYAIKPMNCPCHVQVFNQGLKSYRDLPIRLAEFGSCHRNEPSGSLHGIMRRPHPDSGSFSRPLCSNAPRCRAA